VRALNGSLLTLVWISNQPLILLTRQVTWHCPVVQLSYLFAVYITRGCGLFSKSPLKTDEPGWGWGGVALKLCTKLNKFSVAGIVLKTEASEGGSYNILGLMWYLCEQLPVFRHVHKIAKR
jgi:hypothetical protein